MKVTEFFKPGSLAEAYETLIRNPRNQILGGGAWLKLSQGEVTTLITLDGLGLEAISKTDEFIFVGAKTSLHDLENSPIIAALQGGLLKEASRQIMGVALRNIATIGGSIIGRFGFSDILTALVAMDAILVFYARGEVILADYLDQKRPEKDILLSVKIPNLVAKSAFRKVARTRLDFAILNLAVLRTDNAFKIAIGSRPMGPILAKKAMAFLASKNQVMPTDIEDAAKLVIEEVAFGDNLKACKEYRRHLACIWTARLLKAVTIDEN